MMFKPQPTRILALFFLSVFMISTLAFAQQEGGFKGMLKGRIKDRIKKKLEDKPAPASSSDTSSKITKPGDYTFSIDVGGLTRMYKIHVPPSYNSGKPTPLILSFHGGGGDMNIQSTDKYYGFITKSDKEGFIVAFPNGYSNFQSGILATWNGGTCCGDARDKNIDDVGFVREIIKNLSGQLNIDSQKIFATGMSNGGIFSHRLALEMADTFKAIAPVAGTDGMAASSKPSRPISVLMIHAKNDDHVLFNGGAGENVFPDETKVTQFTSVPETVARWVDRDGCNPTPKRVLDKPGAYCDLYDQCKNNVQVELCVTETGGHSWPGGVKPRQGKNPEHPSTAINADDVMWDFFKNQ